MGRAGSDINYLPIKIILYNDTKNIVLKVV
jgi:hypothetical protein